MTKRVVEWKAAWESRDLGRILALYAPDATHASALVQKLRPETASATLHGAAEIGDYFARGLARFTWLRFDVVTVTEDAARSAVEYRRRSNVDGDAPAHVLELLEWRPDGRLGAVRVFHI